MYVEMSEQMRLHPVTYFICVTGLIAFGIIILTNILLPALFFLMPKTAFEEMKRQYRRWRPSTKSFESEYLFYKSSTKLNFIYLSGMFIRFCYAVSGHRKIHRNLFGSYDFKPLLPRFYLLLVRVSVALIVIAILSFLIAILGMVYQYFIGVLDEKYYLFHLQ